MALALVLKAEALVLQLEVLALALRVEALLTTLLAEGQNSREVDTLNPSQNPEKRRSCRV